MKANKMQEVYDTDEKGIKSTSIPPPTIEKPLGGFWSTYEAQLKSKGNSLTYPNAIKLHKSPYHMPVNKI